MDFDHTYRRHKINAFRNQKRKQNEQEVTHMDSAVTAPYNSFTGITLYKGAALSAEIENYRRRVISLLNFFDSIAPRWWDQLHRFNGSLVKRPSRSAQLVAKLQTRLKARLPRLTPRMVIPAAAAVITIEERDIVSVLPSNLLHTGKHKGNRRENFGKFEDIQEALRLAYSIARRLGEVERSKQQLILYAIEWIIGDGRDFALRAQRLALLTKNIKCCLIENFKGVQALITHYYRRRSMNASDDVDSVSPVVEAEADSKSRLMHAFREVTAASINSTSTEILRVMANADPTLATDPAFTTDFIDNYEPNALPMPTYSMTSGITDVVSQELNTVNDLVNDAIPKDSPNHQKQSLSPRRSQIGGSAVSSGTKKNTGSNNVRGEVDEDGEDGELVLFAHRNSYSLHHSDWETRRRQETARFITKLLALNDSMSSTEEEEQSVEDLTFSLSSKSGSTALMSTLLFRFSSNSEGGEDKISTVHRISTTTDDTIQQMEDT